MPVAVSRAVVVSRTIAVSRMDDVGRMAVVYVNDVELAVFSHRSGHRQRQSPEFARPYNN
jgi:hypothetical protein